MLATSQPDRYTTASEVDGLVISDVLVSGNDTIAARQLSVDDGGVVRPQLTDRELEVLLVWLGTDSKAGAAEVLYISQATVNTHLTRIRRKYDLAGRPARTKAQLLARVIQDGYASVDDW